MLEFALGAIGTRDMFTALGQPAQQQNKTFFVGSGDLDTPKINQTFKGTPSRRSFFVLYNRKKKQSYPVGANCVRPLLLQCVSYGKTQFSPTVLHLDFITILMSVRRVTVIIRMIFRRERVARPH